MSALTASFDDIVFEGRNQAYGAYQLRQDYGNHVASAGGITLALCGMMLAGWLLWPAATKPLDKRGNGGVLTVTDVRPLDIVPQKVIEKPVVAPARPAARPAAATHPAVSTPTQVVQDNLASLAPPTDLKELVNPDGPAGPATAAVPGALPESGGVPGGQGTDIASTAATAPAEPFRYVEKMPEFAGGQEALLRYLRAHLRYPSQALREGQEGRVYMSFVVGADGNISDVQVMKGLGYGLDEEALRVVRQMPAWTPGYQAQHPVPVRFTLPITFKIQ